MTKNEYLESQRGKTYSEIVANQPTELVQGSLLKTHYQEIKTILASGLRDHMKMFVPTTVEQRLALNALEETFTEQYMADNDFKVNFNVPEVMQQYQFCIVTGVLPQEFATRLIDLAKYNKPIHNITRNDCAVYFGGNQLTELGHATDALMLRFRLVDAAPETTTVRFEGQDVYEDGTLSDWYYLTAATVQQRRSYTVQIPWNGFNRNVRWSCEYQLNAVV